MSALAIVTEAPSALVIDLVMLPLCAQCHFGLGHREYQNPQRLYAVAE